ncbi:MAG: ABC transporter ATP-binding protein [Clostridia bacterium]
MALPILQMQNITKRFPGVIANDSVDLRLYQGEIHALLGENGAGKSTLMNILTGIYYPNEGNIFFKGKKVAVHNTRCAADMGIGMVHQHFKLIDPLTVTENVFIASNRCPFFLSRMKMNNEIKKCSEQFNLHVDPAAKVWQLSIGEQQRVEIIKLLFRGAQVLILDEPTAVLTPQESNELFKALRCLADDGKTVMFITHKLGEVMRFADRITVLRGGKSIASMLSAQTDINALTTLMVGREIGTQKRSRTIFEKPECVLKLRDACANTDRGLPGLKNASLHVNKGEILGIAGVAGNGQRELAEIITGLRPMTGGEMLMGDKSIAKSSPKKNIKNGIAYIPEDRMGVGLVSAMNIYENAILRDYDTGACSNNGVITQRLMQQRAESFVKIFDIKNAGLSKPISLMSGGNIQKLLIAREISGAPRLIIAAYPVHGLDIGATHTIHDILMEQRNNGAAILLISEDLDELFEMSDRIAVLFDGNVMGVQDVADTDYEKIGEMMLGIRRQVSLEGAI